MGLESTTTISGLVATNPVGGVDPVSEGDDHIRLLKTVLRTTFPNLNGVVNPTPTELNYLVGVTGALQTQLDAKLAVASYTAADVMSKVQSLDGAGSGLDADGLDGQQGAFYQNASNLNAGTLPDARFPATLPAASGVNLTGLLKVASNLSDLASVVTARANLGVTATGADTAYNARANNLSDVANAATARTNLGLVIGTNVPAPTGTGASGTWAINISGNAATADVAAAVADVLSNVYTPATSGHTNIDSTTPQVCQYLRVGNAVTVSGSILVAATGAGSVVLDISLPVASNFAAIQQAVGVGYQAAFPRVMATIWANAATDKVQMSYEAASAGPVAVYFQFTYLIVP